MTSVTFQGNPMTLSGELPSIGDQLPELRFHSDPGTDFSLSTRLDTPLILTTAPSVDTPVCANQLLGFEHHLQTMGSDHPPVLFVTRDLPFAIDRFCDEREIVLVDTASDFRHRDAGERLGLEITELGLLARTVWIIDTDGTIKYRQVVEEVADEPSYQSVFDAYQDL